MSIDIGPTQPAPDFLGRINRPATSYPCFYCQTDIPRAEVIVVRVGNPDDRPDGCVRFNVGPCCLVSSLLSLHTVVRGLREP